MIQGRQPFARVKPTQGPRLGPEYNPWFWNPSRNSIKMAPESFREKLLDIDRNLAVTWNPITERWQVFDRCGRINHPLCTGWRLLFIHKDLDGGYLPLDERLFARLYAADSSRDGSPLKYFDRVASEMKRDEDARKKASLQDTIDIAMESFDHSQIKVSMRGKSSGSKFADYHS